MSSSILAEANENIDRYYEIKSRVYTIEKVEKRVYVYAFRPVPY